MPEGVSVSDHQTEAGAPASAEPDPHWRRRLTPYSRPRTARTLLDLLTGPVAFLAMWPPMLAALEVSWWLMLPLAVLAAGFLLRTFILFHDGTHGSLFENAKLNLWVGRVCGLMVMHPFRNWRHSHAVHHGSAGDLDRRGTGDVMTMTVAEYGSAPLGKRLAYRLFRNPLVMFGIGPIWSLLVQPRIPPKDGRKELRRSTHLTNLAVAAMVAAFCLVVGPIEYLQIMAPIVMIAGSAGVWLFFVQHQFEDAYWESGESWDYADAALQGSSYLKLPQPLQFFTGNIGLHHVHHLNARIPNYNLQRAHDENEVFHDVPVLTMGESLRCSRLKLIDESSGRLLTFRQARELRRSPSSAPAASASAG
jgi:acyl-lipid omega-6 desaturase (Delta-12 desaturase)